MVTTSTRLRSARLDDPGEQPMSAERSAKWGLYLLLAALAVVCLATLRGGHPWGDDFALYVLHARSLVEGRAYGDTGFVYNPATPMYSPRVYPPGFPLLLAPIYAAFGVHLFAFRLVVIASFVGAVAVFALIARRVLSPRMALAAVALVAFQPFLLRFKNLLLPDFTFMFFMMVTLYCVQRAVEDDEWQWRHVKWGALAGVALAAAISMRTIGVTFFGGLVLYQVLRWRLPRPPVLATLAVVLALYGLISQLMPPSSGYVAQLADTVSGVQQPVVSRLSTLGRSARDLVTGTDVLWSATGEQRAPNHDGASRALIMMLMAGTGLLVLVGFRHRLRRVSIIEPFVVTYVGALVVWGATNARYLVPVMPFVFYYAVIGFAQLTERGPRIARNITYAFGLLVILSYAANLIRLDRSAYGNGVTGENARAVYEHVRRCTAPDALIAATRPRALALFTERRAMRIAGRTLNERARLLNFLDETGADYVIASPRAQRLAETAAAQPELFRRTFTNSLWVIYRVESGTHPPARADEGCSAVVMEPDPRPGSPSRAR